MAKNKNISFLNIESKRIWYNFMMGIYVFREFYILYFYLIIKLFTLI